MAAGRGRAERGVWPPWVRERDSWYVVLIVDRIGVPLVRGLDPISWVNANRITIVSFIIRGCAVALWVLDLSLVGFILWQAGFLLDCMDGQLARKRGASSRFGALLDEGCDRVVNLAFILVAGQQAGGLALILGLAWYVLWSVSWGSALVAPRTSTIDDPGGGGETRQRFVARYKAWAGALRLKPSPITGIEEIVLLLPLAHLAGLLTEALWVLVPLRAIAAVSKQVGASVGGRGPGALDGQAA